jgi:hypothetical protein
MENYQARWKLVLVNTEPMDTDDIEGMISLRRQNPILQLTILKQDGPAFPSNLTSSGLVLWS